MLLIDYRDKPVEALRRLEMLSEGNEALRRVWRANIERVRNKEVGER